MPTHHVTIEETVSQTFLVEADTPDEALALARRRYRNGTYVLAPGELTSARIALASPADAEPVWEDM